MSSVVEELLDKAIGDPPITVLALIASVIESEKCSRIPIVKWRVSKNKYGTSGRANGERIVITAGSDKASWTQTALHEVAHHLMPAENHSVRYYQKVFELYKRYGLDMTYVMRHEFWYKGNTARMGASLAGFLPDDSWWTDSPIAIRKSEGSVPIIGERNK